MKCRKCGHKVVPYGGGMGSSSAPGYFFYAALASWATTAVLWLLGSGWGVASGAAAVIATIAVLPAIWDQNIYDGLKCEQCGTRQRIRPWTL